MRHLTFATLLLSTAACGLFTPPQGGGGGTSSGTTGGVLNGSTGGSTGALTTAGGSGSTSSTGGNQTVVSEPNIRFVGRFDKTNPAAPVMGWSNSTIEAGFAGTQLTLHLQETQSLTFNGAPVHSEYDVSIDGAASTPLTLRSGVTAYPVAQNLAPGNHTVRLVKRTEAQMGVDAFLGLASDGGAAPAPLAKTRRMEFVGDSITCGYGDLCATTTEVQTTPPTENANVTYAAITAASFQADIHVVAFSGKGMWRNITVTDPQTVPMMYGSIYPNGPAWDFSGWTPQVVVINLGTNDFTNPNVDDKAFVSTYVQFIQTVRGKYPSAIIVATLSPMLSGTARMSAGTDIKAAVAQASDANTHYFEFDENDGPTFGCDFHPSQATHAAMAQKLIKFVSSLDPAW